MILASRILHTPKRVVQKGPGFSERISTPGVIGKSVGGIKSAAKPHGARAHDELAPV